MPTDNSILELAVIALEEITLERELRQAGAPDSLIELTVSIRRAEGERIVVLSGTPRSVISEIAKGLRKANPTLNVRVTT